MPIFKIILLALLFLYAHSEIVVIARAGTPLLRILAALCLAVDLFCIVGVLFWL